MNKLPKCKFVAIFNVDGDKFVGKVDNTSGTPYAYNKKTGKRDVIEKYLESFLSRRMTHHFVI